MGEQNPPLQGFHNLSHYSVLNRKGMITLRNVTQTTTLYFILSTENTKEETTCRLSDRHPKGFNLIDGECPPCPSLKALEGFALRARIQELNQGPIRELSIGIIGQSASIGISPESGDSGSLSPE